MVRKYTSAGSTASPRLRFFRYCRIAARAFAVTRYDDQEGFGVAPLAVMISTVCPLRSGVRSGTRRRSTFAATQRLPTSVWIA